MNENTKDDPIVTQTNVPQTQQIDATKIAEEASKIAEEKLQDSFDAKADEIAQKATQEARKEIAKQISGEKEEDKWVPKDYDEIVDKAKKEMRDELETNKADEDKKQKEDEKKAGEEKEESLKKWNKYWDNQIKTLEDDGLIEKVDEDVQKKLDAKEELTDEDKNDPGLKSREKVFAKARELKETNLELVAHKYLKGVKKKAGRSDAPIAGVNRGGFTPGDKSGYSYEDVHNSSIEDILSKR